MRYHFQCLLKSDGQEGGAHGYRQLGTLRGEQTHVLLEAEGTRRLKGR